MSRVKLDLTVREATTLRHALELYSELSRVYHEQQAVLRMVNKIQAAWPREAPKPAQILKRERPMCSFLARFNTEPCQFHGSRMVHERGQWRPACAHHARGRPEVAIDDWYEEYPLPTVVTSLRG